MGSNKSYRRTSPHSDSPRSICRPLGQQANMSDERPSTMPLDESAFKTFQTVALSAHERIFETVSAEAAFARLRAAHSDFILIRASNSFKCKNHECRTIFEHHAHIRPESIANLDEVYCRSLVISTISLLDSFLSDVTRILFLLHPQALPTEKQIKLDDILKAQSKEKIIESIIERHVHELSYKKLEDRVRALAKTFGLKFDSANETLVKAQEAAELRNRLVHDVSAFTYGALLNEARPAVRPKSRASKVKWDQAKAVMEICLKLMDTVYTEICEKIFKRSPELMVPKLGL